MKIILETDSSNPAYNGDCDYAVVDLTPSLVERIHRRIDLARQAGQKGADLCELYFWASTAEFYDSGLLDACQESEALQVKEGPQDWLAALEENGHARLPDNVDFASQEPQRTECDQLIVRCGVRQDDERFEIAWTAIPKHSDIYVTTRDLSLAALEAYLRQEAKANTGSGQDAR